MFADGADMNTFHSEIKVPFVLYNLSSGEKIICCLIPSLEVSSKFILYLLLGFFSLLSLAIADHFAWRFNNSPNAFLGIQKMRPNVWQNLNEHIDTLFSMTT